MTNMETSHLDGTLARAKAESASRDKELAALPADEYRQAPRPGLTRAQLLTLLAVALVPIGLVLCGLWESVDPNSALVLLVLVGPFVLLSAPLFLGTLALIAAKPQGGSLSKRGRVAGLVALTIAFLLSLPFAALLAFGLAGELACRGGEGCL